jgi:hypothetical protein
MVVTCSLQIGPGIIGAGRSPDLNPGSWSIPDATFLIKSGIRKEVRDEEEVHGGSDRLCSSASGERDAGGGDRPEDGDLGGHVLSLEEEVCGDGRFGASPAASA